MIEKIAMKLAKNLKQRVPDHPASVDVLAYAFNFSLNTGISVLLSLIIALFLKNFLTVLMIIGLFALLRMVSGGYHFKSAEACILVSAAGTNLIAFSSSISSSSILWINIINLLLVLCFAPSRIEHQSRIPKKYFPLLKFISCGIVSVNFLIQSPIVAVTFLVQGVSLLISLLIERRESTYEETGDAL